MKMNAELMHQLATKGGVRGPYTKPSLPALAERLTDGSWPLPLWSRGLTTLEISAIERRGGVAKNGDSVLVDRSVGPGTGMCQWVSRLLCWLAGW